MPLQIAIVSLEGNSYSIMYFKNPYGLRISRGHFLLKIVNVSLSHTKSLSKMGLLLNSVEK